MSSCVRLESGLPSLIQLPCRGSHFPNVEAQAKFPRIHLQNARVDFSALLSYEDRQTESDPAEVFALEGTIQAEPVGASAASSPGIFVALSSTRGSGNKLLFRERDVEVLHSLVSHTGANR